MSSPQNPPLRVVIDSSVLVAILRHENPGNNWLIQLWRAKGIIPLASLETLHELEQKLLRHSPTPDFYLATKFVERAMRRYEPWCELVEPQDNSDNPKCADPDDQKFIDLAFEGNADVILARDRDLRDMNEQCPFEIMVDRKFRTSLASYNKRTQGDRETRQNSR